MSNISIKSTRSSQINDGEAVYFGNDPLNRPLEVLVFSKQKRPNSQILQKKWKDRQSNRRVPLLVVCLHQEKAYVCGPNGEKSPIYNDLDINQIERICNEALQEPNRFSATSVLTSFLPTLEDALPGIRNEGFLSTNELKYGARDTNEWSKACDKAKAALNNGNKKLIESLGFDIDKRDNFTKFLRFKNQKRALGILLDRGISPDLSNPDFANQTPVSHGMSIASQENLPYVIIKSGGLLRIYPVDSTKGIGSRGRTETFIEINTSIISDENCGLLWLIFSGKALKSNGSLNNLIEDSYRYGSKLANSLRSRIYNYVIPLLCKGISLKSKLYNPSKNELQDIYDLSLLILFRLLFISYAEDRNLLPFKTNDEYKRNSLQTIAKALLKLDADSFTGDNSYSYWQQLNQIFSTIYYGNKSWAVPAYGGNLFSSDPKISLLGSKLEKIKIDNSILIPTLQNLLLAEGDEGLQPVDFRSLSVREFGSIYEALLDSELVYAKEDLYIERSTGLYRPVRSDEKSDVKKNEIYMQNTSGARKETASFYTKNFAVNYLIKNSVSKSLKKHFQRLNKMSDEDASKYFFDIKFADISMGSGHFLISTIDLIEEELENYRSERSLPGVSSELNQIRQSARTTLSNIQDHHEIDDGQLIRRLIAKRCIYGVDLNAMAVELARLSIWIHTFVPGLPLSYLDRNLVIGDSLSGIGSLEEIDDYLKNLDNDGLQQRLFKTDSESILGDARKHLTRLANISEASIDDIERERQAWDKANEAIAPAIALCDIIIGTRINDLEFPHEILDNWIEHKDNLINSDYRSNAVKELNIENAVHFPTTFPEVFLREKSGFDAIIGNPPWEEATLERHAFWARYFPGLRGMNQRMMESKIEELSTKYPELQNELELKQQENKFLRKTLMQGPYPGMGTGDVDLYKAFCWRFWNLCNDDSGFIGVVVPRSVINSKGSSIFRKKILSESRYVEAISLLNTRHWVFDIHAQYIVLLLTIQKGKKSVTKVNIQGHYEDLDKFNLGTKESSLPFLGSDVLSWTDYALFPSLPLPASKSTELMLQLAKHPSINCSDKHEWEAYPHSELHATNDKKDKSTGQVLMDLTTKNCPDNFWPVYKGASFDLLEINNNKYYAWSNPDVLLENLQRKRIRGSGNKASPFSKFKNSWIQDVSTLPSLNARIAFRDITNSLDARTIICALVPPQIFLQNTAPYLLFPKGDEKSITFLLGVLSSISLDWWARRFVGLHLNFFILNSFPIPLYSKNCNLCKRLVEITGKLSCVDDRFTDWAEKIELKITKVSQTERDELMYELDGIVAKLYGLTEDQLKHIFDTYRLNWDYKSSLKKTLQYYNK